MGVFCTICKYFKPSTCKIGRPSLIWLFSKHHPFETAKAIVVAKMISGRYRTDWFERHWSNNKNGFCLAITCTNTNTPGDLTHMFVVCPAISQIKLKMKQVWIQKTKTCPPLACFLASIWDAPPETFVQFLLEPSIFPEVAQLCEIFGIGVFRQILYLTRSYAFYIDRVNRRLRNKACYFK